MSRWKHGRERALAWSCRHQLLAAAGIYAALALVMFGQGLVPGRIPAGTDYLWQAAPWTGSRPAGVSSLGSNFELSDSITQFQPFLLHARGAVPDVPLWNPHVMGGRPFLANAQSAVFSPFTLPAYVLPFWHSLAVMQIMKLFVAALGVFVLGRSLGMRFAGALLAGTIFGFSQGMVDWASWPHTNSWPLLPWLLLLVDRLLLRPSRPVAGALAIVVALELFGGHPETIVDVAAATVAWFVFRLLQRRREWPYMARRALAFGVAMVAGAGLAAIALVPFAELLLSSWDYDSRRGAFGEGHLDATYLRAFFMPDWWGRPTQGIVAPFATLPMYGHAFYAGALSLLLAAAALAGRRRAEVVALAVVAVVALAAMVALEPFFSLVTLARGPAKMDKLFFYVVFAVAVLAGFGLDELRGRERAARHRLVVLAGVLLLGAPVVWAVIDGAFASGLPGAAIELAVGLGAGEPAHLADASETAEIRMGAVFGWIVMAGAGLALVTWRVRGGLRPGVFAGAAVALVVLDLFKIGMGYNPAIPASHAFQPSTGAIGYLQSRRPARFVGIDQPNLLALPPLAPNLAMRYGLYDVRGYDFPVERRFARLWSASVAPVLPEPHFTFPTASPRALRALGLLGVADVLQDIREGPVQAPGLSLGYAGPDARVYTNAHALPRAFVASAQMVVRDEKAALAAVTAEGFDARNVVVSERRLEGLAERDGGAEIAAGAATLRSYEAERVVIDATLRRTGVLVLTDTYSPGWTAEIDGKPAKVNRVDYLLRGVVVPPGRHRVEFWYRPASWRAGWIISLATLLAMVGVAAGGWWGARARRG